MYVRRHLAGASARSGNGARGRTGNRKALRKANRDYQGLRGRTGTEGASAHEDAEEQGDEPHSFRGPLVLCLEAQDIFYRDAVQMTADFPGGQSFRVDELVDRFTSELPAAAQLRHRQPCRTDAAVQPIVRRRWT